MTASKRDILVRNAMNVLYREGFNSTGMDALAEKTGVSKMTMYKHFRSKDDLILAALRLRDEEFMNYFIRRVEGASDTAKGQLLAVFDAMADWIDGRDFYSCLFIKASSEFQDPQNPIFKMAVKHKQRIMDYIHDLAKKAEVKDPDRLARQLFMLVEGETVMAFMLGKKGVGEDAKKAAQVLVTQALGH